MIGAILTGGYGKRMQSLADNIPKTLLKLKNEYTILDRQILDFASSGVKDIYLLTGFKGDIVRERYGGSYLGSNIHYLQEEKPMGTLWAVRNLFRHVDDDVILRNGDTICDLDMADLTSFALENGRIFTIVLVKMISPYGIVKMRGTEVTEFLEKPVLNHYINAGYYYFRKGLRKYLEMEFSEKDIEKSVFPLLASENQIAGLKYHGFWKSVDSVKDYEEIVKIYSSRDDYDFGSVHRGEMTSTIRILRGKEVELDGNGWVRLMRGKASFNGKHLKKNVITRFEGRGTVRAEIVSYVETGDYTEIGE